MMPDSNSTQLGRTFTLGLDESPEVKITPKDAGKYLINISGRLPLGWIGALSIRLSQSEINIENGSGEIGENGLWRARLEVQPLGLRFEPTPELILRFIKEGGVYARMNSYPITLNGFFLRDSPKDDGSVLAEIFADDSVGFLAAVLNKFSLFSLYPREFRIDTVNNSISDSFLLYGIGGSKPSQSSVVSLGKSLQLLM